MLVPRTSYLIAATPRSGSTLLCDLLASTGAAGRPAEHFEDLWATGRPRQPRQYFTGAEDLEAFERLAPTEPGAPLTPEAFRSRYDTALQEGTTSNGVFATNVMWGYLPDLVRGLRTLPRTAGLRPPQALATAFPGLRYVQILRRDKVAQAVSLWTALQTARWRADGGAAETDDPEYSFAAIDHLMRQLAAQEQAWTRWFAVAGITPVIVVYEQLAEGPRRGAHGVLEALELEPADVKRPRLRRQAAERSREWAARYEAERLQVAA